MTTRYPIAIETGTSQTAFGVVVLDLPGCFSAGDTRDDAVSAAKEAAAAWIEATLDASEVIPPPARLDDVRQNPDYAGWAFDVISIDPAWLSDKT